MQLYIGLISGTSMDGIDAGLIEISDEKSIKELGGISISYDLDFKKLLKSAELAVRDNNGDLNKAKLEYTFFINKYLLSIESIQDFDRLSNFTFDEILEQSTKFHGAAVNKLLRKFSLKPENIVAIGYHGQTLFHRPSNKITIQVGNGQLLADLNNITVINDFRSEDMENGGQGAPLAPLYHKALAIRDKKYQITIVNCGGIANITFIIGTTDNDVIGFDTGPGNGLIDKLIKLKTHPQECMDENGKYGTQGKVKPEILKLLFENSVLRDGQNYFNIKPPKSLDIGDLRLIEQLTKNISLPDACATLAAFTTENICQSVDYLPDRNSCPKTWILAGGGWNNPVIFNELVNRLKIKIQPNIEVILADQIGWSSQYMESYIFAYLAYRKLNLLPTSLPKVSGVNRFIYGGIVYEPSVSITAKAKYHLTPKI